jgi:hypothetical protein
MSDHDPFDGIYDEPATQKPVADDATESEAPAPAVEVSVYTNTQLTRMRKADLQAVARERGLDSSGDREELIERIEAAQGASA